MFSKILDAVDGSPDAKKALDYAISLVKTYGSILTVMYVVHRRVYVAAEEACFAPTAALIQDVEEQGKKILDEAKGTAQSRGVELDIVVVHGISTEETLKKAEADKYDRGRQSRSYSSESVSTWQPTAGR